MRPVLLLAACFLLSTAASAAPCTDAVMRLRADDGREFVATRYGIGRWQQKTERGRLPYAVHVWQGNFGGQPAFLHFTEIPGTSGPNWGSERMLTAYRAKIAWQEKSEFRLPEFFRAYSGPLQGAWTLACGPS